MFGAEIVSAPIVIAVSDKPQYVCPSEIAYMDRATERKNDWTLIGLKNGEKVYIENDIFSVIEKLAKSLEAIAAEL